MTSRTSLIGFVLCAYAFAWIPALIVFSLEMRTLTQRILLVLAHLGPLEASLVWAWLEGAGALHRLARSLLCTRSVNVVWLLAGFVGPLVCWLVPYTVAHLGAISSGGAALVLLPAYSWESLPAFYVLTLVLDGPLSEELGWRAFALPRLQMGRRPFTASLLLSIIWGAWHAPSWLFGIRGSFVTFILAIVPTTFVLTWLYHKSRGHILACILAHTSLNVAPQWWDLNGYQVYKGYVLMLWLAALAVVASDWDWFWDPPTPLGRGQRSGNVHARSTTTQVGDAQLES